MILRQMRRFGNGFAPVPPGIRRVAAIDLAAGFGHSRACCNESRG